MAMRRHCAIDRHYAPCRADRIAFSANHTLDEPVAVVNEAASVRIVMSDVRSPHSHNCVARRCGVRPHIEADWNGWTVVVEDDVVSFELRHKNASSHRRD